MSKVGKILGKMWSAKHAEQRSTPNASLEDIHQVYAQHAPYTLGVYYDEKLQRRERKQIYTTYKIMMQDPTIAAALNILVTAALGGHENRGECVFIEPSDRVKGKGARAKKLREMVQKEAPHLQQLIDKFIFSFARNGVGYGDAYIRPYAVNGKGVTHVLANELVDPPLIQAFEQAGITVGYHVLEITDFEIRHISKLTTHQMLRMKMQRMTPLPVFKIENIQYKQLLQTDDINEVPVIPSMPGGSLLDPVKEAWEQWVTGFAALNSQQIADSVNVQFATMDVSGMPEAHQEEVKQGMIDTIQSIQNKVRNALKGGEEVWMTNWAVIPTWGDKQILNPMGDPTTRSQPLNMELVLTHLKRGMGALGLDLSILGWMEMISGGLGDGAAFHTSAQIMQNAILIRQAITEPLIELCIMHFAYKYGVVFKRSDLPFNISFYSEISAAMTEANNNRLSQGNLLSVTAGALAQMKELGLDEQSNEYLLTNYLKMDYEPAQRLSKDLVRSKKDDLKQQGGFAGDEPNDNHADDDLEDE